jgi:hypothetical protein
MATSALDLNILDRLGCLEMLGQPIVHKIEEPGSCSVVAKCALPTGTSDLNVLA